MHELIRKVNIPSGKVKADVPDDSDMPANQLKIDFEHSMQ